MNIEDKTTFFMNNIYCFRFDVKKIIFSVVRNDDIADDLTQTVLEKAWKGLDMLENREEPFPWVKGIVRNEIRAYLRKKKKDKAYLEIYEDIDIVNDTYLGCLENDVLEVLSKKDRRECVVKALEMLDDKSKEIVILHLVVELPLKQIAEDLNLNYGSTRVFYSRAIKKLRSLFLDIERGVL